MKYKKIVVLTGAGISAESGIKTFREVDGLWENYPIEEVATPKGFQANPKLVQQFYNERRRALLAPSIKPNLAHRALAQFEQNCKDLVIITQNIDNLHEQAGSKNIIHIHGELLKMRCTRTNQVFDIHDDINPDDQCPCCQAIETLRPHIVWFGEMPFEMARIQYELSQCDLFMAIGTSGHVYPAAGFVRMAKRAGAHTVELNLKPSKVQSDFDQQCYEKATKVVPQYLNTLL